MKKSQSVNVSPVVSYSYKHLREEVEALDKMFLGVVVVIDNEEDWKESFDDFEREAFTQVLSSRVSSCFDGSCEYVVEEFVDYKDGGSIIFEHKDVKLCEVYGGYFLVFHYDFVATAS